MGLLQKIKESRAAQYATGALAGLGMMASAQGNNLSEQEINRQALLQSQPETYQVAQDTTDQDTTELRGQEKLDQLCNEFCMEEAVQKTYNILANQASSREVLVDDQYSIPFTQGQDQVNISDLVTIRDGEQAYLQVDTDEGTQTYNLEDLTTENQITTSNNATIQRDEQGNITYNTTNDTNVGPVSYAILTRDEDETTESVRLVMAHGGNQEQADQYTEQLNNLLNQNERLQGRVNRQNNRIEALYNTLNETEEERDAEKDLREETQQYLSGWGISAEGGLETSLNGLTNPRISVGADFPTSNNTSGNIALVYGQGGNVNGPTQTNTTSETVPRGPREGYENVQETTENTTYTLNNSIGGRLELPVNTKLRLGAEAGIKNFTNTTNTTDISYTEGDGEQFNRQQDQLTETDKTTIPYTGINASYNISDNVSVTGGVNMTFTDDTIDTTPFSGKVGVRYTIR